MPEVGGWVSDEDERVGRPRRCAQHLRPRVSRAGKGQRRGATLGATHHEQVPRRGKRGQRPGEVFGGAQAQAVVTDRQPANSVTASRLPGCRLASGSSLHQMAMVNSAGSSTPSQRLVALTVFSQKTEGAELRSELRSE